GGAERGFDASAPFVLARPAGDNRRHRDDEQLLAVLELHQEQVGRTGGADRVLLAVGLGAEPPDRLRVRRHPNQGNRIRLFPGAVVVGWHAENLFRERLPDGQVIAVRRPIQLVHLEIEQAEPYLPAALLQWRKGQRAFGVSDQQFLVLGIADRFREDGEVVDIRAAAAAEAAKTLGNFAKSVDYRIRFDSHTRSPREEMLSTSTPTDARANSSDLIPDFSEHSHLLSVVLSVFSVPALKDFEIHFDVLLIFFWDFIDVGVVRSRRVGTFS